MDEREKPEEPEDWAERPVWIPGAPKVWVRPESRPVAVQWPLRALREVGFGLVVLVLSAFAIMAGAVLGLGLLLVFAFAC